MTENSRTLTYIGVAAVLLVAAGLVNRKPVVDTEAAFAGKVLFPELKSPDSVAGLEIVTLDESGTPSKFRVIRESTGWALPSHNSYPADAEKQVASAATSLIDLKVLDEVSSLPSEHSRYGVLDPEKASPGSEGAGKLVNVLDKSGNNLARLVIGKKDAGTSENSQSGELRFVRALPRDAVYRVSLPDAKFSTNFAEWIETDLLKLDPWDITQVTLKDYTIDVGEDPRTGQRVAAYEQASTIDLTFSDKDAKWSLKELLTYQDREPMPTELAADEELNTTRLNEMKTALDDLKIVDVSRKPAKMSSSLKADKSIFEDMQAMQSLDRRGFYVIGREGGEPEILSSNGEVVVRMKDGVEYLLRFGGVASVGSEEKKDDDASDAKKEDGKEETPKPDDKGSNLNRYIMVSASFNRDLIPKPELQPLPEGPDAEESVPDTKSEKSADTKSESSAGKEPALKSKESGKEETKDDKAKRKSDQKDAADGDKSVFHENERLHFVKFQNEDSKSSQDKSKSGGVAKPEDGKTTTAKALDTSKKPASSNKSADATKNDDAKKSDAKKNDAKKTEETQENDRKAADIDAKKEEGQPDDNSGQKKLSAEDKEELTLERKRIQQENDRKQKEYDDKVKKGETRARDLNARFAEWYYVVSESTYRKIHLDRQAVIKKKAEEKKDDAKKGIGLDTDAGVPGLDFLK